MRNVSQSHLQPDSKKCFKLKTSENFLFLATIIVEQCLGVLKKYFVSYFLGKSLKSLLRLRYPLITKIKQALWKNITSITC